MLVDAIDKRPIEVELECGFDGHASAFSKLILRSDASIRRSIPASVDDLIYDASVSSLSSGLLLLSELHPSRGPTMVGVFSLTMH